MTTQDLQQLSPIVFLLSYPLFFILESLFAAQKLPSNRWSHAVRNTLVGVANLLVLGGLSYFIIQISISGEMRSWSLGYQWGAHENLLVAFVFVLFYDMTNYWIHRSLHIVPGLWRLHRTHHSDHYLDVTSAFYFHPSESVYRASIQALIVWSVGLPPLVLALYQVWVVFALFFSHANLKFPAALESVFQYFIVLPTAHRVHHSHIRKEHDSNFGIGFMMWDHIFGTYTKANQENQFRIGLKYYPKELSVLEVFKDPFKSLKR